ncbi:MAG: hypothetical protein ACR2P7_00770 [bacterium]
MFAIAVFVSGVVPVEAEHRTRQQDLDAIERLWKGCGFYRNVRMWPSERAILDVSGTRARPGIDFDASIHIHALDRVQYLGDAEGHGLRFICRAGHGTCIETVADGVHDSFGRRQYERNGRYVSHVGQLDFYFVERTPEGELSTNDECPYLTRGKLHSAFAHVLRHHFKPPARPKPPKQPKQSKQP